MSETIARNRLAGKTAIVTGAASGFGAAIANLFAEQGANVLVADVNAAGGEAVASKHENAEFFKLDVTASSQWQSALDFVMSKWGKIDILINNAGTSYRNKPTLEVTQAEFDKCFTVNVNSVYHSVNTIVPKFIEQGTGGVIVNISSIGSSRPRPGLVWYNASKGAVSNVSTGTWCLWPPLYTMVDETNISRPGH